MPRPAFYNPVTFTAGRLDINGHVHGQRWTVLFQCGHVHGWPSAVKILYGYGRSVIMLGIRVSIEMVHERYGRTSVKEQIQLTNASEKENRFKKREQIQSWLDPSSIFTMSF